MLSVNVLDVNISISIIIEVRVFQSVIMLLTFLAVL